MKWTKNELEILAACICIYGLSDKRYAFKRVSNILRVTEKAVESAYYRHFSYIKDRIEYLDVFEKENERKSNTVLRRVAIYMKQILHKIKSWFTYYG